jgi:hypothetical protein
MEIPNLTLRWLLGEFVEYQHFNFCAGLETAPAANFCAGLEAAPAADASLFRAGPYFHAGTGVYTFEVEPSTSEAMNPELLEIALQASSAATALDSDCSPVHSSDSDRGSPDADAVVISNVGGFHSKQDFLRWDRPACSRLSTVIGAALRVVTHGVDRGDGTSVRADESWVNVSFDGDYNALHDHEGFAWSGVYYVATADPMLNWCACRFGSASQCRLCVHR